MRRALYLVVMVSAVFAVAGTALAKGPESATITGPGIEQPLEVMVHFDGAADLVNQTGLWSTSGVTRLEGAPSGDLGPGYTLTWVNSGPPEDTLEQRTIHQVIYPDAAGGPIIHTPPQLGLTKWGSSVIGWFAGPAALSDTLSDLGVPSSEPAGDQGATGGRLSARRLVLGGVALSVVVLWVVARNRAEMSVASERENEVRQA